jgi:hypothetical protein
LHLSKVALLYEELDADGRLVVSNRP